MSSMLQSFSKFYYGIVVDTDNYQLDFDEGGSELTAELEAGEYTLNDFLAEIKRALEDAGALTYTVTANRSTRVITIAGSAAFSLLVATGTHAGTTGYSLIGFTGADRIAGTTFSGNAPCGYEYVPQFKLQSYVSSGNWQQAADASINKTANGVVEVIKFGTEKFFQFDIKFATEIPQPCNSPILNNSNGVEDLQLFMQYCTTRSPLEFMPDKDLPNTFYKIILESTPDSQNGVGYKLKELYDKNLPGYFETGVLKWRLIED